MTALAVFATYDAEGRLWPHVRHQIVSHARDFSVVLVAAGELADKDLEWASQHARVVQRENSGYDFACYLAGLEAAGDLAAYDQVVLLNDSFVGPVVPLSQVATTMAGRDVDFWGVTASRERREHLQSYLLGFSPRAVASEAFAGFWHRFEPVNEREEVIARYELGLTSTLASAGLTFDAYFAPTPADLRLARARRSRVDRHLITSANGSIATGTLGHSAGNPCIALADRVLSGRLPVVKIETLRDDPYGLGADTLLALCEEAYPTSFAGVRDHLAATRADRGRTYAGRARISPHRTSESPDLRYGST